MRKYFLFMVAIVCFISLTACKKEKDDAINVSIHYTAGDQLMSISYQKDEAYESLDGNTYVKGDLLPVWKTISDKLDIKLVDKATSSDVDDDAQFERLQTEGFKGVDLVNGTGAQIGPEGVRGNFVDIGKYLNQMPHLNAFLEANPAVKVSMTAADGGIYFTPYFDGFGELEQMFLARIDWIEDILDVENPSFDTDAADGPNHFEKRMVQTPINVNITVANEDGSTRTVNKNYDNNILDVLAAIENPTGESLANAFRQHIEDTYGDQGYEELSHVFTGTDAAYDTDELIALMYVVKANPKYLTRQFDTPLDEIEVYFPREGKGNRIRNLLRGLEMFGMRGVLSRHEYLYFDEDGLIQDIRYQDEFIEAVNALSDMYNDKLIVQDPEENTPNWRSILLNESRGFITYDYNASSTASSFFTEGRKLDEDMSFQAILPPVVDWLGNGKYFHFTESVRSVKNEAWGIPKHVEKNEEKLDKILELVDGLYDYSTADSIGTIHLYGPQGWTDGTIEYGNDTVYKLSDAAKEEMQRLAGGNHINYLRQYVGATMPIGHIRSLGLEFQTLSDEGSAGIERINTAITAGVFRLAGQYESQNPWYRLSPTFYPITESDQDLIDSSATFVDVYDNNALITLVKYGFSGEGGSLTVEDYRAMFDVNGLDVYNDVYIKAYRDAYNSINE